MKAYLSTSLVVSAILLATPFRALASCGTVEVSKGDIQITSGSTKAIAAAPVGSKICSGDTIVAGADSRAKLKMEDGNELNISPDSKILIENYQYNPTENKKKVLLNVLKGKVRATTKQENMYNDKASDGQANTFEVRTKTAVAGVRGTDFLTSYNPATQTSEVVTFRGKVSFGQLGPNGTIVNAVSVSAGQKTDITVGKAPAAPVTVPAKELDKTNTDTKASAVGGAASSGSSGTAATTTVGTSAAASGSGSSDSTTRAPASTVSAPAATAPSAVTPSAVTAPSLAPPTLTVPPIASVVPAAPIVPNVPTVPKCDICTQAQETNKTAKVNITIKIKN